MTIVLLDRVGATQYSANTPIGIGAFLPNVNLTTYQPISVVGNTNQFYYLARHRTQDQWEVGLGQVDTSGPITAVLRTAANVYSGSSGVGALVSFSAGNVDIISCFPASVLSAIVVSAGAPLGAAYAMVSADPQLTGTRILTAGPGLQLTDGGAGGSLTFEVAPTVLADMVTSVEASVSSLLETIRTGGTVSIYLNVSATDERYTTAAALTSVTDVLGTSIANTNAAVVSVQAALTSLAGSIDLSALVSINNSITSVQNALTSTNAATPRLAGANIFTAANTFNAVTSVLRASGAVQLNGVTSVSTLNVAGAARFTSSAFTVPAQLTDATSNTSLRLTRFDVAARRRRSRSSLREASFSM